MRGVMIVLCLAVAMSVSQSASPPQIAAGGIRVLDLTLDRVARITVPLSSMQPIQQGVAMVTAFPPSCGLALISLTGFWSRHDNVKVRVMVNGTARASVKYLGLSGVHGSPGPQEVRFDPPVIVGPGQVMEVQVVTVDGNLSPGFESHDSDPEMTIAGWVLFPGDV